MPCSMYSEKELLVEDLHHHGLLPDSLGDLPAFLATTSKGHPLGPPGASLTPSAASRGAAAGGFSSGGGAALSRGPSFGGGPREDLEEVLARTRCGVGKQQYPHFLEFLSTDIPFWSQNPLITFPPSIPECSFSRLRDVTADIDVELRRRWDIDAVLGTTSSLKHAAWGLPCVTIGLSLGTKSLPSPQDTPPHRAAPRRHHSLPAGGGEAHGAAQYPAPGRGIW